jgi:hypothetical protein
MQHLRYFHNLQHILVACLQLVHKFRCVTVHPSEGTCTPDDKQARAMIKIIQKLQSNFIQIVYSEGTYGEGGRDAIRREAKLGNICIKNEIVVYFQ